MSPLPVASRIAVVAVGALLAVTVLAFANATLTGLARDLVGGALWVGMFLGMAAGLTWALRPAFVAAEGLRVPPLALSVFGLLVLAAPVIVMTHFTLYGAFGGSK